MGRPVLDDDQKRKQIAVRLSPDDRARIQRSAEEHGNSLGAEVERLALAQMDFLEANDAPTRALLGAVSSEINEIHKVMGKRWHAVRAGWAAVAEMLRNGPIMELDPDRPDDDPAVKKAWDRLWEIQVEKDRIARRLREVGVSVSPENPLREVIRRGGLDGEITAPSEAIFVIRHTERAAVEALPDGPAKDEARALFERLLSLDQEEHDADERWSDLRAIYSEAESEGRQAYHQILQERAKRRRAEGQKFVLRHLMGIFPRWP